MEEGQEPGLGHVAFHVEDVESTYSELASAGICFSVKPQYGSLSRRTIAITEDPDGHKAHSNTSTLSIVSLRVGFLDSGPMTSTYRSTRSLNGSYTALQ